MLFRSARKNKSRNITVKSSSSAAVSEATTGPSVQEQQRTGVEDRLIQIERLARLREGGLLTAIEFEKEKEKILRG